MPASALPLLKTGSECQLTLGLDIMPNSKWSQKHTSQPITTAVSAKAATTLHVHLCEVHEVLKTCVEVCFLPQPTDTPEVSVIDVCIHPEESLEDSPHHIHEVGGEGHPILLRKYPRIIHLHTHTSARSLRYHQNAL